MRRSFLQGLKPIHPTHPQRHPRLATNHDGQGLLGGFGGIVNECVGVFAGAQGAVGVVAAVGEGLGTNASQDSTDVVFGVLGHQQVWRGQQLLLLQQ